MRKIRWIGKAVIIICSLSGVNAGLAYDVNDQLSFEFQLAGVYQHQEVSNARGAEDTGREVLPLQAGIRLRPTPADELFFEFGFAAGNGLNDGTSPFVPASWAGIIEDDTKDINGRGRNYLLAAWYRHRFLFSETHRLSLTGGIIDATDYLDQNAYANDEYTQFMNAALVNAPTGFLPSYDFGAAAEWTCHRLTISGVVMNVGENRDENEYTFYAVQAGYALDTTLGKGNYRLIYQGTSQDFLDPRGTTEKARLAVLFSFDQQLGDTLGAWIRIGRQDDRAAINFKSKYSGGLDLSGKMWGRDGDNFGIGYAYLDGGNLNVTSSQVFESYVRFALNTFLALTLDLQYLKNTLTADNDLSGFIYGLRLTANF